MATPRLGLVVEDKPTELSCRFFYERQGQFTPDQLVQLQQASLSKVICDNADNISTVPINAFVLQERSEFVGCDDLPSVDLILWKECEG